MISVVLWGIEHPGNLGAIARLCANFEVEQLVLVDPLCSPDDEVARNRAKHAQSILENAKVITPEELREFDVIIATTAQTGTDFNIARSPLTPKQLAPKINADVNVALVFGPEGTGLTNEQVALCDFALSIPTSKEYRALNLSHAVAIVLYELFVTDAPFHELVPRAELDAMYGFMDELVNSLEFSTEEKRETQRAVWKKLFAKSFMTRREAFAVIGLIKKLMEQSRRKSL